MSVAPIILTLGVEYGTRGGPRFRTGVAETDAGFEARSLRWADGLVRADLGQKRMTDAEWSYLQGFFRSRRGRYEAFLYRDWTDDRVVGGAIGTGDGVTTTFQLVKHYGTPGTYDPVRTITHMLSPWNVYKNGVKQTTGVTVSAAGVVTFTAAPAGGVAITADFFFVIPVRFDTDEIEAELVGVAGGTASFTGERYYEVGSVPIVEVRE